MRLLAAWPEHVELARLAEEDFLRAVAVEVERVDAVDPGGESARELFHRRSAEVELEQRPRFAGALLDQQDDAAAAAGVGDSDGGEQPAFRHELDAAEPRTLAGADSRRRRWRRRRIGRRERRSREQRQAERAESAPRLAPGTHRGPPALR